MYPGDGEDELDESESDREEGRGSGGRGIGFENLLMSMEDGDDDEDDDKHDDEDEDEDQAPNLPPYRPSNRSSNRGPKYPSNRDPNRGPPNRNSKRPTYQPVGFEALFEFDDRAGGGDPYPPYVSHPPSRQSSRRSGPYAPPPPMDISDEDEEEEEPPQRGRSGGRSSKRRPPPKSKSTSRSSSRRGPAPLLYQGTVVPVSRFSAESDAESLRKAMKGVGCDRKAVSAILCARSNAQRQEIKSKYRQLFGRHLNEDLISELRWNHKHLCIALLFKPEELDAVEIRRAVKGAGTNESILIEILASRSNAEIAAMKHAYKRLFKRVMRKDIESDTSFHFKKLMRALTEGARDESGQTNRRRAATDAAALYQAGEKKLGTDEPRFNAVLAAQGFPQLRLVFAEYAKLSKNDLERVIRSEFSGSIRDGLLAVVKCAKHPPTFFAEKLYLAMKGLGTKDRDLIRLVVSRAEVDMVQVKEAFQHRFGKPLTDWVVGDTSGSYREALLLLINGNRRV